MFSDIIKFYSSLRTEIFLSFIIYLIALICYSRSTISDFELSLRRNIENRLEEKYPINI